MVMLDICSREEELSTPIKQRWVVKAGSNILCNGGPLLLRDWMTQVKHLRKKHKIEIIWVTSGAIASAVERTSFKRSAKKSLSEKQALSAIGQPIVMDMYNLSLQALGMLGAQVLLTYDDLAMKKQRQNFVNTIHQLLKWGVLPILNENDAVATEEIKFGDNDSLSAKVAVQLKADRLVLLTDVDGVYDSDPRANHEAKLLHRIIGVDEKTLRLAKPGVKSKVGTGGMYSKLMAARHATKHGVETWIARGDSVKVLSKIAENREIGTQIVRK